MRWSEQQRDLNGVAKFDDETLRPATNLANPLRASAEVLALEVISIRANHSPRMEV